MERVTVTASGLLVCEGQRAPEPVLRLLGRPVDFEQGVTLPSIASLIQAYPPFHDLSPFVPTFLESVSCGAPSCNADPFHTLEIYRTIDMKGYPGTPEVQIFLSLKVHDGSGYHPLDYFSSDALQRMPLRLGKLRHTIFGDTLDTELFHTDYTLFDVLESLMWELSFFTDKTRCGLRRP